MAHEIESTDAFGEVQENGERAWHGLGVEIPNGVGAWDAFQQIGLDWETELCPLTTVVETSQGTKRVPIEKHFAHVRKDTENVLGVVSEGYKPISNRELADFADALVGADAAVVTETAGSLRHGKRVFALVRLPKAIEVTDEDILNQYVLLSNSHDGSSAFQVYPTSVRVVCANTLRMSERDSIRGIRFQHTGAIDQKIHAARAALGVVLKSGEYFEEQVRALADRKLSKKEVDNYFVDVYTKTYRQVNEDAAADGDETAQRQLERRKEVINEWEQNMEDRRQMLPGIKGTAWAACNAVTQWHDHDRGRMGPVKDSKSRVHSNLFGASHQSKRIAFNKALELTG